MSTDARPNKAVWLKIGGFVVGVWILGQILPEHPGVRTLAFVVGMIAFIKWLEQPKAQG